MIESEANSTDLWTCLHDGVLESLHSDASSRTVTFIVDSPFHRDFHKLPDDTRMKILGEGVRATIAFRFESWPDSVAPPPSMPHDEAEKLDKENRERGRYVSSEWQMFVEQLASDEEHIILSAELEKGSKRSLLKLGVNSYPSSDWYDLEIRADTFRFFVGSNELTVETFEKFGDAYWDDWNTSATLPANDKEKVTDENV